MLSVLVTGANGFVGRRVCAFLRMNGYSVREVVRSSGGEIGQDRQRAIIENGDVVSVTNIDGMTDWSDALENIDIVVHLAARVHVMREISVNPLESFRSVNVRGTERLARAAVEKGMKRFVYISSISIHGNFTGDRAYVEDDEIQPNSPYAISKWEGEQALRNVARESGLEVVIVRPPLVYGPGVGGNFLRLMRWTQKGLPLPLKSIHNKRSFIGVENLADLIECCVASPAAAGETFVVSDGEDLSTPDLIDRVARLMGRSARLVSVPVSLLRMLGRISGQGDIMDRLCSSLRVDASKARTLLGWRPNIPLDVGLGRTVQWYMEQVEKGEMIAF